jgi:hypothetical protein
LGEIFKFISTGDEVIREGAKSLFNLRERSVMKKGHMDSDNVISSCHLPEWYRWAERAWEEVWERVWDAGGEEKGEGIERAEGKAGGVGS